MNYQIKNFEDIDFVETLNGSNYRYLPDGHTQRFKKTANRMCEPQDVLVYIPSFEALEQKAPSLLEKMGAETVGMYEQTLLEYVQGQNKKCRIIDKEGNRIGTNKEAFEAFETKGQLYIALCNGDDVDFWIPVSRIPRIGFYTYDTRKFEKDGQWLRESHMGHEVVRIALKNGEIIGEQK